MREDRISSQRAIMREVSRDFWESGWMRRDGERRWWAIALKDGGGAVATLRRRTEVVLVQTMWVQKETNLQSPP